MADGTAIAAAYMGNRTIEVLGLPVPELRPGEVEIAPAYTGICGTDLHIFHGDMDQRVDIPAVIGHEMSGRIAAMGAGVDRLGGRRPGHRHAAALVTATCPACLRRQQPHLPQARLHRHRLARRHAAVAGPCRQHAARTAARRPVAGRTPRWSSRPPSPCTTSAAAGSRPASRWSSSVAARSAC